MPIAQRLSEVEERIAAACARAGRRRDEIELIAVTKAQDAVVLNELAANGIVDYGENRLDHLELMRAASPTGSRFHYIGRVQSRQLPKIAPICASLHSLSDIGHIDRLGRACAERRDPFPVFLQVNTAGEAQKAGLAPEDLDAAIDRVRAQAGLALRGLMCMAPDRNLPDVGEARVRSCFAVLRDLAHARGLQRLSMGMSGDYELAVEEGATDLRIGSTLFA